MQHWPAAVSDEFSFGRSGVRQSAGGGLEPTQPCGKCHAERSPGISQFFWEYTNELTFSNIQHPTSNAQRSMKTLAGGGARTHTALRPLDFESSASANSATPAL